MLVKEGIGLPAWYLGALDSTFCFGVVMGALALGHLTKKITPEMKITGGTLLMAIAFLLMPTSPHMALPLSMMFLFGMGNTIFNIPLQTQMALAIPDSYRARFDSILGFGCGLAAPLGMAMAGSMIERFGTPTLLVFMGSVFVCLTPLLLVNKEFIRFMRLSPEDAPQYFDKGSIHSSQAGTPAVVEVGFVDATSDSGKI